MDIPPISIAGGRPVIPHGALASQKQGQAVMIWTIGAFCIYGWELFICLPKEYRLIWKRPMNLSSVLYLANRYYGLVQFAMVVTLATDVWPPSACKRIFLFEPIGTLVSVALSQMVLGGRVYAVFSQSKQLGLVLASILVAELIVGGVAVSHVRRPPPTPGISGLPSDLPPPPCGALTGPFPWLVTYWTIPLFYDTLTFLLTAWKAHSYWREEMDIRLFEVIWRDGLLYFFVILTMNVINVVIFVVVPIEARTINLPATIMLEVILSCRLILNLRESHNQSTLHPNFLKTNNKSRSFSKPERAGMNLEAYWKAPQFSEFVCNVEPIQRV